MKVKFYTDPENLLWNDMKGKICQHILDNHCGEWHYKYRIHFDKMFFTIGWFIGFVEIWKGRPPRNKNKRQIPFVVHVIDWEGRSDCKKREDYQVLFSSRR